MATRSSGTEPKDEGCDHPLDSRRTLGLDKQWKPTGTYCQKCGTVLERFPNR